MALTCTYGAHAQVRTHAAGHNESAHAQEGVPRRGTPDVRSVRALARCTEPSCRLAGYRIWVDDGTAHVCECGTFGTTATDVAKHHLALARESLKRRPA